ncbi:hypothetical protein H6G17_06365 [Chroococcidiopsis sp. FACHB-1243]|uniref:hypothetical protein n=1 Tax=Chroococcidiopsis sp. [FACHB-1243] TaxID=2692781 RepID=UPI0017840AA1|nr:hypothetical protein [Chroococcidiopsis sp. [FACHB-1243]]
MLQFIYFVIQAIQPILVPVCFVSAWAIVALIAWSLYSAVRDSVATSQKLHQIPCTNCQFFTGDYRLKCTVQPTIANTEAAITCMDYQAKTNPLLY